MSILKTDRTDGVLTLTLNRPDSLNALSSDLQSTLIEELEDAASDSSVRCVVVQGAGKAFSAGGDVDQMRGRMEEGETSAADYQTYLRESGQRLVADLYHLPVPTIAKVTGACAGAGFGVALACDLLVADETAKFTTSFRTVGFGPDAGTSFTLSKLVGPKVALELLYTGEVVSADRAQEIGLVNRVVDSKELDGEVDDLAVDIAAGPTRAFAEAKRVVHDNHERGLTEAVEAEAAMQSLLRTTHDHQEGVAAFVEDRDPEFEGR
jgi:enoyl-CoA hydratase/carnithine racemase